MVAVRGAPEKTPISPIDSPTPISLMAWSRPSTQTSNRPDTTIKTESEGVFCRTRASPRVRLSTLACDQTAVSCSSDSSRKMAVERSRSAVLNVAGSLGIVPRAIRASRYQNIGRPGNSGQRQDGMFKVRVIPRLDVKDGRVVKGGNFVNLR